MNRVFLLWFLICSSAQAIEHSIKGLIDVRVIAIDNPAKGNSYLEGDYGKFNFDSESSFALAQLGINYKVIFDNGINMHVAANAYKDKNAIALGITEAFLNYKSLPTPNGWRLNTRVGLFYPKISLENISLAWSTPYTLTSSSLNNWMGEELRHSGVGFRLEKLGKFSNSKHNFTVDLSLFQNNDTAGAMLAWHGWTVGNRQTLIHEKLLVQPMPARQEMLINQAAGSDPFIELDNRWGSHLVGDWQFGNKLKLNMGYYNNNVDPNVVKEGQYTWGTDFYHLGFKYKVSKNSEIISQWMQGSTSMNSPYGSKVVDNQYKNGFVMLRHLWNKHHIALRAEEFSISDLDSTWGDNNQEYGKGLTVSYRYRLNKTSFIHTEYNWLQSIKPARYYLHQDVRLIERQYQIAFRRFF